MELGQQHSFDNFAFISDSGHNLEVLIIKTAAVDIIFKIITSKTKTPGRASFMVTECNFIQVLFYYLFFFTF